MRFAIVLLVLLTAWRAALAQDSPGADAAWPDWRFWQIVVTGGLAFLGFTFGTWVKHWFDLRLDARRHAREARAIAIALRAELAGLMMEAGVRWVTASVMVEGLGRIFPHSIVLLELPTKLVFANNTHRLGDLGDAVASSIVDAHTMAEHQRANIVAVRARAAENAISDSNLKYWRKGFESVIESAAIAINALDDFLGEPQHHPDLKLAVEDELEAARARRERFASESAEESDTQ